MVTMKGAVSAALSPAAGAQLSPTAIQFPFSRKPLETLRSHTHEKVCLSNTSELPRTTDSVTMRTESAGPTALGAWQSTVSSNMTFLWARLGQEEGIKPSHTGSNCPRLPGDSVGASLLPTFDPQ